MAGKQSKQDEEYMQFLKKEEQLLNKILNQIDKQVNTLDLEWTRMRRILNTPSSTEQPNSSSHEPVTPGGKTSETVPHSRDGNKQMSSQDTHKELPSNDIEEEAMDELDLDVPNALLLLSKAASQSQDSQEEDETV